MFPFSFPPLLESWCHNSGCARVQTPTTPVSHAAATLPRHCPMLPGIKISLAAPLKPLLHFLLQDKQQSLRRPLGKPRDRRRPDRQKERLVGYFIQRLAKCLEKRGLDSPETTRTARMHAHTFPLYLHTTPALQFQPVESHKGLETLSRGR